MLGFASVECFVCGLFGLIANWCLTDVYALLSRLVCSYWFVYLVG